MSNQGLQDALLKDAEWWSEPQINIPPCFITLDSLLYDWGSNPFNQDYEAESWFCLFVREAVKHE